MPRPALSRCCPTDMGATITRGLTLVLASNPLARVSPKCRLHKDLRISEWKAVKHMIREICSGRRDLSTRSCIQIRKTGTEYKLWRVKYSHNIKTCLKVKWEKKQMREHVNITNSSNLPRPDHVGARVLKHLQGDHFSEALQDFREGLETKAGSQRPY